MNFLNIGTLELMVIIAIAILAIGPKRMVQVARTIGRMATRMRQISSEFTTILRSEFAELDEARQEVQGAIGEIRGTRTTPGAGAEVAGEVEGAKAAADQSMESLLEDGMGLGQIASELRATAAEARQFMQKAADQAAGEGEPVSPAADDGDAASPRAAASPSSDARTDPAGKVPDESDQALALRPATAIVEAGIAPHAAVDGAGPEVSRTAVAGDTESEASGTAAPSGDIEGAQGDDRSQVVGAGEMARASDIETGQASTDVPEDEGSLPEPAAADEVAVVGRPPGMAPTDEQARGQEAAVGSAVSGDSAASSSDEVPASSEAGAAGESAKPTAGPEHGPGGQAPVAATVPVDDSAATQRTLSPADERGDGRTAPGGLEAEAVEAHPEIPSSGPATSTDGLPGTHTTPSGQVYEEAAEQAVERPGGLAEEAGTGGTGDQAGRDDG